MRYVIYGAGAVGGGIGARLAQHGHEPVLIARGAHLDAMRRDGLRLRAVGEDERVAVAAVGRPSELDWRGDEVVILTMKGQDTAAALADLLAAAGPRVPVICAQNGVENERMAARYFHRVYAMLVQMPATHLVPGEVILNGVSCSGVLDAGVYPHGLDATIEQVCSDLSAARFISDPDPRVLRLKYAKLLYVSINNAVDAICGPGAGTELRAVLREEALAVYAAAGIEAASGEEFWARDALMTRGDVPGFTRAAGSTWQSLVRGAGSMETDYLNGEISLLGLLHGVPTPANRAVQACCTRAVREHLEPGFVSGAEVLALAAEG